jgi:hypothetical protein
MAKINANGITTDARRATAYGRTYVIPGTDYEYPSVTNVDGIINKPALVPWSAKVEREACIKAATLLNESTDRPVFPIEFETTKKEQETARMAYSSVLSATIGKVKAGQKLMTAAGEIGTHIHAKCEWHIRNMLGDVYPAPTIPDAAEWGFMAFEDWAKKRELKPIHSELVVYSHVARTAGTLDLHAWITLDDGTRAEAIVDFKTGKAVYSEAYLQTSFYAMAMREMNIGHPSICVVLRLPKNIEDPEFEEVVIVDLEYHWRAFLAARELWQWNNEQERLYKDRINSQKQSN